MSVPNMEHQEFLANACSKCTSPSFQIGLFLISSKNNFIYLRFIKDDMMNVNFSFCGITLPQCWMVYFLCCPKHGRWIIEWQILLNKIVNIKYKWRRVWSSCLYVLKMLSFSSWVVRFDVYYIRVMCSCLLNTFLKH